MAASATPVIADQAATTSASGRGNIPFDFSQPPIIEGFNPLPRVKDETFKEKFLRKTKDNPFVPIGKFQVAVTNLQSRNTKLRNSPYNKSRNSRRGARQHGSNLTWNTGTRLVYKISCLATAGALMYGLRAFHQGKTRQSQLLMRGRIFAQGFTVVAIVVGVVAAALKPKE